MRYPTCLALIAAVALFGCAYFTNRWHAIFVPMAVMLLSDTILEITTGWGFHSGMIIVYAAFALVSMMGMILVKNANPTRVISASLISSLIFYLITNFAFLYPESSIANQSVGTYPHNFSGIMSSYAAGLPFLKNQIMGDLFYSGILFGGFALLQRKFEALKMA